MSMRVKPRNVGTHGWRKCAQSFFTTTLVTATGLLVTATAVAGNSTQQDGGGGDEKTLDRVEVVGTRMPDRYPRMSFGGYVGTGSGSSVSSGKIAPPPPKDDKQTPKDNCEDIPKNALNKSLRRQ